MANQLPIGTLLAGRFRIVELLGAGAMGEVYVAEHLTLGRRYAIKVLKELIEDDKVLVERFRREARATSRLDHPNIVYISDFGKTEEGRLYLVMEYIPGESLRQAIEQERSRPLSFTRGVRILAQICNAVAAAHNAGVVHRDLKPENILLAQKRTGDDLVKILDFGLAKIMETSELTALTHKGEIFGTPAYMSPEQGRGDPIDHRTDIYSVGVMAFEILTGRLPFAYDSLPRVLIAHQREPAPALNMCLPPGARAIPPDLEQIVLGCLEKDPAARPQHATEIEEILQRFLPRQRETGYKAIPQLLVREDDEADESDWCEVTGTFDKQYSTLPSGEFPTITRGAPQVVEDDRAVLWERAVKKAKNLAQSLRDRRLGTIELTHLLGTMGDLEERVMSLETEIALAESRLEDLDRLVREGEARLRGAVVDLSVERGRLLDSGGAAPRVIYDLDYQIGELERRLAELFRERDAKQARIQEAIQERQQHLSVFQQRQVDAEVHLLNLLHRHRPPQCPADLKKRYDDLAGMLRDMQPR